MWSKRKPVLCTNCGFLGWHAYFPESNIPGRTMECSPYWRKRIQTEKDLGSDEDPDTHENITINCTRNQWTYAPYIKSSDGHYIDIDILTQRRNCSFSTSYQPGYKPEEHKELKREAETRRVILISSLLSGLAGAVIGTVATIIVQLLST